MCNELLENQAMTNFEFELETPEGPVTMRGAGAMVDGGMKKMPQLVPPCDKPIYNEEKIFTTIQEALRKLPERGFGVLKRKFKSLKHGFELWDPTALLQVIQICAILHNMCMEDDGTAERGGTDDFTLRPKIVTRTRVELPPLHPNASPLQKRVHAYAVHVTIKNDRNEIYKLRRLFESEDDHEYL